MSKNEKENIDWPVLLLIPIVLVAFIYGGLWIGLITLFVSLSILGWGWKR